MGVYKVLQRCPITQILSFYPYHKTHSFLRLCAFLTFLTRAHVRPETPTYVPLQPLFIPDLAPKDSSSSSNVFVSTTHSYVYVAFSITTSFSTLYPSSCLLRNTILDPFSTYLAGLGLLVVEHAFYALRG